MHDVLREESAQATVEYAIVTVALLSIVLAIAGLWRAGADGRLAALAAKRWRIMLAGGLRSGNIRDAVETVKPYGVDLSSSLEEAPGIKSEDKMREFFKEIRK